MNAWTVFAPHAYLNFSSPSPSRGQAFYEALAEVPGVKERRRGWQVPRNALEVVDGIRAHYGMAVTGATWDRFPDPEVEWADVESCLREGGEVRDWVYDFLLPYQKEAIAFAWSRPGSALWHGTGSGKTLTACIASLSCEGPVLAVTRAASRVQFGREIERFLRARALVVRPESQTQSAIRVQGESYRGFMARHRAKGLSGKEVQRLWAEHKETKGVDRPPTPVEFVSQCSRDGVRAFVVVGWEALLGLLPDLQQIRPGTVIFDEAHRGKSTKRYDVVHLQDEFFSAPLIASLVSTTFVGPDPGAPRGEVLRAYANAARLVGGFVKDLPDGLKMFIPTENTATTAARLARIAKKRIGTTATPITDRVRDLWAQLDLIEPNAWGSSSAWRTRYADMKPGRYGGMDDKGASNLGELNLRLRSCTHILSYKQTHAHLPAKRRRSLYIAPEDQNRATAGFAAELRQAQERGHAAILEVRLAQAASLKRKAVLEQVESCLNSGQKVVVFTARRKDCELLTKAVKRLKLKAPAQVWGAHGGDSQERRQAVVDEYMREDGPSCLVGTGQAFGESLNLDKTDEAFFVMLPLTPGQLRQWEGRFHRASTRRPVLLTYVIAEGTVDEHHASILINKLPAVEEVVADDELMAAADVLAGYSVDESAEEFAASILAAVDY